MLQRVVELTAHIGETLIELRVVSIYGNVIYSNSSMDEQYNHYKVSDEITFPYLNLNGAEIWTYTKCWNIQK